MIQAIAYTIIFALTFVVVAGAAAAAWAFLERERSRRAGGSSEILRNEEFSTLSVLSSVLSGLQFAERMQKLLDEADSNWSVGRMFLLMLICGTLTLALLLPFQLVPAIVVWAIAGVAACGPVFHFRRLRGKRVKAVETQLPEALDFISRALVAGHALPMSLELLADEVEAPLSTELRKTVDEYNLGLSMQKSLENLSDRVPSVDLQFFASAILTQSRTGGSLHEVLDNLAETIRERETLKGQVRAMTANGRMSAMVLSVPPFFVAGVMTIMNPGYLLILWNHPVGRLLVFGGLISQVAAFFVIRKIADIQV